MALAITIARKFTESDLLPQACVVTGRRNGAVLKRIVVSTPLAGDAKKIESEIQLPFTRFGGALFDFCPNSKPMLVVGAFALWCAGSSLYSGWERPLGSFGQLVLGVLALLLALASVASFYIWWILPAMSVVDSFGGVQLVFPDLRKALYEEYCEAYAQWQEQQGDNPVRMENSTNEWADQVPNTWDEAAGKPPGPGGG